MPAIRGQHSIEGFPGAARRRFGTAVPLESELLVLGISSCNNAVGHESEEVSLITSHPVGCLGSSGEGPGGNCCIAQRITSLLDRR
jgi:hypothetical protein